MGIVDAPADAIVVGLKELEDSDDPLGHRHIHFAHVYKNQSGWERTLRRFVEGGGWLVAEPNRLLPARLIRKARLTASRAARLRGTPIKEVRAVATRGL